MFLPSVQSSTPLHSWTSRPLIVPREKCLFTSYTGRCTSKCYRTSQSRRLEQLDRQVYEVRHGQYDAVRRFVRLVHDEHPAPLLRILKGEWHDVRDALQNVPQLCVDGGYRLDNGTTCGPRQTPVLSHRHPAPLPARYPVAVALESVPPACALRIYLLVARHLVALYCAWRAAQPSGKHTSVYICCSCSAGLRTRSARRRGRGP
ncbi:hypothetical protein DFH11DRAFT_460960 [Phellopilus nigrolimitatus]|nr:hypothetical protein DFH11DRAFT_460960 [Phellopilus nigrolimitatus]